MIVHLDIKIKNKCKKCHGCGNGLIEEETNTNQPIFFEYMCTTCNGNGYTWKKRTITSKQLKGILDEKD